ncbi:hypothetical protein HOP38_11495 [Vibrio mediterranei]|uniref:Excisionase-like domain-containing protein n=1 Tax=Vibrio maritimus TaxID=990268 RepID=A0A090SKY5_9VIBR|nr:excisionase [Vibrio mediterranei]NUW73145.1 hypothetical protein [Vibrio mediterranei]GAL20062.1 hypothetical protein JCM19235_4262 [Vibrio maritimus]
MHITIREWAIQEFGFAPSASTLASYAKTKQIHPAPVKFGGKWMCDEKAVFVGLCSTDSIEINDPVVARIFRHGS